MRYMLAVVALVLLSSCDADRWAIKSNPSGDAPHPDGGLVVVVVKSTLPKRQSPAPEAGGIDGKQTEEPAVEVYLLTGVHDEDLTDADGTIRGLSLMQLETAR